MFCVYLQMCVSLSEHDVWKIKKKKKYKNKLFVHVLCLSEYVCLFVRIWHMQFPFQGVRSLLFEYFPGATMLPRRQNYPFREWDVYYSNLFQAPQGSHKNRIPFSGIEKFVIRIFSRRHYATTKAEFPFKG